MSGGVFTGGKLSCAKKLLHDVEQVGFLETIDSGQLGLKMMGGELCINALLAAAYSTGESDGELVSELGSRVKYRQMNQQVSIELDIPSDVERNYMGTTDAIVVLGLIGYVVTKNRPRTTRLESELAIMATKLNLPAFGLVWLSPRGIVPYVYVCATSSCVSETACGSGSLAAYLTSDAGVAGVACDIFQPTGSPITIRRDRLNANRYEIAATVSEVTDLIFGLNTEILNS